MKKKDPDISTYHGNQLAVRLCTNGVWRTFIGQRKGNTFRVYRIEGDVTRDLAEAMQELAIKMKVDSVEHRPSRKSGKRVVLCLPDPASLMNALARR